MGTRTHGFGRMAVALGAALTVPVSAQHGDAESDHAPSAVVVGTKNPPTPTHAPKLALPPLVAWQHVRTGNEAVVAARAAQKPTPPPAPRPAGSGRYVCAVIVCADVDVDVASLLGLARRDVLLLTAPGPFVQPEAVALLEQAVADERLSLVLVIGHANCRTLATKRGVSPGQDALAERLDSVRREAERTKATLVQSLVRMQAQQLLTASERLRQHARDDSLRVLPAELDPRSGALSWHHRRIDEFMLRPVR